MVVAGRTADTAIATAAANSVRGCFILLSPISFVFTLLIKIENIYVRGLDSVQSK
jgi:hypothetical protein